MSDSVLYVYAVAREAAQPNVDAIDESKNFGSVTRAGVTAIYTRVSREGYAQEALDRRAGDLEWLGAIGYRHQAVVNSLMKQTTIIPLRAFTLFSSEESLGKFLEESAPQLRKLLERLDGKQEWTLRIEFDPERWNEALVHRVASLRDMTRQIEDAGGGSGKAFLLRKKLDEEKKRASRSAEEQVVGEIEKAVLDKLTCETVAETREQREGAFPQINVLINRDEEAVLQELHSGLADRYTADGVTLSISGPWPPYTFARIENG
jgi:hypothetical protein